MGGTSKKKAAKRASAEVKASAGAATAAAMTKAAAAHQSAAAPPSEPHALCELVRIMHLHAAEDDPQSLVDETHAHILRSLGPAPDGQALPDSYGEMGFYALTMFDAGQRGLCGDAAHAYLDEELRKSREAHGLATDRALRAYLAEGAAPERALQLCLMLSHAADARTPVVQALLGDEQQVHMGAAGHKGDGVFASRDIPAGVPFTLYPCHGIWVGGHAGRDRVGRFFASSLIFPSWEGELNMRYAIDVPWHVYGGPPVMVIGHHLHRAWFACGHVINDSHSVEEVGGPDAYRALARGNCEPRFPGAGMGAIVMFTTRAVVKGEELLYTYGADRWTAPPRRTDPHGQG